MLCSGGLNAPKSPVNTANARSTGASTTIERRIEVVAAWTFMRSRASTGAPPQRQGRAAIVRLTLAPAVPHPPGHVLGRHALGRVAGDERDAGVLVAGRLR